MTTLRRARQKRVSGAIAFVYPFAAARARRGALRGATTRQFQDVRPHRRPLAHRGAELLYIAERGQSGAGAARAESGAGRGTGRYPRPSAVPARRTTSATTHATPHCMATTAHIIFVPSSALTADTAATHGV